MNLDEFEAQVGVYQGSLISQQLFAIVVNVITKNARRDNLLITYSSRYYAQNNNLVNISKTMENLKRKILELERCIRKQGFEGQH